MGTARIGWLVLGLALLPASVHAQSTALAPEIATQVRSGRDEAALGALADLDTGAARYLRGRLLERLGRYAEAAAALDAPRDLPTRVTRDALLRRGRDLLHASQAREAERVLTSVTPSDATIRALVAEAVLVSGDDARAETLLDAVVTEAGREVDTFAARMELAEAALGAGHREAAQRTLRSLVVMRPEHPDAAEARAAWLAIDPSAELTLEEHLDRAERLIESHRAADAVTELDGLTGPATSRARLLHVRGMALFEARRYADAEPVLTASAAVRRSTTAVSDAFHAARALLRAGQGVEARRALTAFVRANGDDPLAIEAEYLEAQSELGASGAHASRAMQRFVDGPRGRHASDFVREARFVLGLVALDADDGVDAARRFELYRSSVTRGLDRDRADYWRARSLEQAGQTHAAYELYRTLVRGETLGWYALMSRDRLQRAHEPDPAPLTGAALPDEPAPLFEMPPEAAFYASLGLDADAAAALVRASTDMHRSDGPRAMSTAYLSLFDFHDAYRITATSALLDHPPTGAASWAWDTAYPRAFETAVVEAAGIVRITPELIWSVMRQESAFDPEVVSYADAIGLMQLMPATAAIVARRTGASYARNVLFDATTNVRLGAAYLAELDRRYGVPLCFAAYNAGEHRVEEWLARGEVDLDRFVENIPFAQTRNYTRRVSASLAHYRFRAAPDAGWPDLGMPARVGHAP